MISTCSVIFVNENENGYKSKNALSIDTGVIVNNRLTAVDHVATLLSSCSRTRAHRLPDKSLQDVFHAVVVSHIEYAAPAWSGMCSAANRTRLDSLLRRSKRLGYCRIDQLDVADMFSAVDNDFSVASS